MVLGGACEDYSQCEASPQDPEDPDLADIADVITPDEVLACNLSPEIECTATIDEYEACIVENTERLEQLLAEFSCTDESSSAEDRESYKDFLRLAFTVGPECTSLGMQCGIEVLPNPPIPFEI